MPIYDFKTGKKLTFQENQTVKRDENRRLYICTICGKEGYWDENWSRYGSYLDIEEGKTVEKYCSDECARKSGNPLTES